MVKRNFGKRGYVLVNKKLVVSLFVIGLGIALVWGITQYQARQQWEINAENQYQRAFADLATHMDHMEAGLTKLLVSGSFLNSIRMMSDIWREANLAQTSLGQLPLTSLDLSRTKMLIAKVNSYCFKTIQNRLLKGQKLNEGEWKNFKKFQAQVRVAANHLMDSQKKFLSSQTKWLDVDRIGAMANTGLATADLQNNEVAKSFIMLEDGLKRIPDVNVAGDPLNYVPKPTGLIGKKINIQTAKKIARQFLDVSTKNKEVKYERKINGGFPSYMLLITDKMNSKNDQRLSISRKGGHVVWILGNRLVRESKLSLEKAKTKAMALLKQNGYPQMKLVATEKAYNITTFTFVPIRKNICYYTEMIKVQVAMDNGQIWGFDASSYLTFFNNKATPSKPKLSREQIRKNINDHFKVKRIRLAEVIDEMYNKVLCYEVEGTMEKDRFLIYYNANNGREEKIRQIDRYGNEVI